MDGLKCKAIALIAIFQIAILELSEKMSKDKEAMSEKDVENVNYVAGMASVNSFNLEQVISKGEGYYKENKFLVDRLFIEAGGFADALKSEGYGRTV